MGAGKYRLYCYRQYSELGGLIMWVPGNIVYIVIVSILFIRWMQGQEVKQREQEALQDSMENGPVLH